MIIISIIIILINNYILNTQYKYNEQYEQLLNQVLYNNINDNNTNNQYNQFDNNNQYQFNSNSNNQYQFNSNDIINSSKYNNN